MDEEKTDIPEEPQGPEAEETTPPANEPDLGTAVDQELSEGPAPLRVDKEATIQFLDDEGEIKEEFKCLRGMTSILRALMEKLPLYPGETQVKVMLTQLAEDDGQTIPEGAQVVIGDDNLETLVERIRGSIMPIQLLVLQLQQAAMQGADQSTLKGIIVTVVSEGPHAGGFGMLTETSEISDEDIIVLAEAAQNQVDLFKSNLRKARNIEFPGDSVIITPGQGGIIAP